MDLIGEARIVLLGGSVSWHARILSREGDHTRRLIQEKGFTAVAVEADWPDTYRVNRYVLGRSRDANGLESLADFKRFPTWMWRNRDVLDFVTWLRAHNESQSGDAAAAGFYGLDLYSLHASMGAVLEYLDRIDPESAQRARSRYACFDHYGEDTLWICGWLRINEDLRRRRHRSTKGSASPQAENYLHRDGFVAEDEFFFAEQNARLVKNAERVLSIHVQDRVSSWNLRDRHMAETLTALMAHLSRRRPQPQRSSSGHTIPISATHAAPRWADRRAECRPTDARALPSSKPC